MSARCQWKFAPNLHLFDHIISAGHDVLRYFYAKCLRSLRLHADARSPSDDSGHTVASMTCGACQAMRIGEARQQFPARRPPLTSRRAFAPPPRDADVPVI